METIKTEVTEYWGKRAEQFAALRLAELASDKRQLWSQELTRYLPAGQTLRILDVGTGSGFFALILSAMGHHVTGIDLTPEMISAAQEAAHALHLTVDFLVMDAEQPSFSDSSFDVVLSRNLTWTLPHLEQAYAQWKRILKPGGLLLNFDADYCREQPSAAPLPANHAHKALTADLVVAYEHLKSELAPGQQPRPAWDTALLHRLGFQDITVDPTLSSRLYQVKDAFYNPTPMFTIAARRGKDKR